MFHLALLYLVRSCDSATWPDLARPWARTLLGFTLDFVFEACWHVVRARLGQFAGETSINGSLVRRGLCGVTPSTKRYRSVCFVFQAYTFGEFDGLAQVWGGWGVLWQQAFQKPKENSRQKDNF